MISRELFYPSPLTPLAHPVRRDWSVIVIVDVLDAINNSLSGYEFIRFLDVNFEAGCKRQAAQNV
jgi:hypothetical protein